MFHSSLLSALEVDVEFHFNKCHCKVQSFKGAYFQASKHMKMARDHPNTLLLTWIQPLVFNKKFLSMRHIQKSPSTTWYLKCKSCPVSNVLGTADHYKERELLFSTFHFITSDYNTGLSVLSRPLAARLLRSGWLRASEAPALLATTPLECAMGAPESLSQAEAKSKKCSETSHSSLWAANVPHLKSLSKRLSMSVAVFKHGRSDSDLCPIMA